MGRLGSSLHYVSIPWIFRVLCFRILTDQLSGGTNVNPSYVTLKTHKCEETHATAGDIGGGEVAGQAQDVMIRRAVDAARQ